MKEQQTESANQCNNNGNRPFFQPKLSVNQPNDVYEQEADTMVDKVMRMPNAAQNDSTFFKPAQLVQQGGALQTANVQRELKDPMDVMAGYTENTIASIVLDSQTLHAQLTTIGGREYDGFVRSISKGLPVGNYQADRVYGPDALRTWNIFKPDNSVLPGGMMFEVEIPSVDFNNLGFKKRVPLSVVSGQFILAKKCNSR